MCGTQESTEGAYSLHSNELDLNAFRSTISRSPTSTPATTIILFENQICNRNNLFHKEFVNLGAILNILLREQYISILKNH